MNENGPSLGFIIKPKIWSSCKRLLYLSRACGISGELRGKGGSNIELGVGRGRTDPGAFTEYRSFLQVKETTCGGGSPGTFGLPTDAQVLVQAQ